MPSRKNEYRIFVVVLRDTIKLNSNFAGSKSRKQHVQTSRGLVKYSKYIGVRSLFSCDAIKINQQPSCKNEQKLSLLLRDSVKFYQQHSRKNNN